MLIIRHLKVLKVLLAVSVVFFISAGFIGIVSHSTCYHFLALIAAWLLGVYLVDAVSVVFFISAGFIRIFSLSTCYHFLALIAVWLLGVYLVAALESNMIAEPI